MGTPHFRTAWRDEFFVENYLATGDAAMAAKAACSKAKDLDRAGRELLERPEVQAQLHRRLEELAEQLEMPPEDVLLLVRAIPLVREIKKRHGVSSDGRVLH
jgi:phage terminase small subunit